MGFDQDQIWSSLDLSGRCSSKRAASCYYCSQDTLFEQHFGFHWRMMHQEDPHPMSLVVFQTLATLVNPLHSWPSGRNCKWAAVLCTVLVVKKLGYETSIFQLQFFGLVHFNFSGGQRWVFLTSWFSKNRTFITYYRVMSPSKLRNFDFFFE